MPAAVLVNIANIFKLSSVVSIVAKLLFIGRFRINYRPDINVAAFRTYT